MKELYVCLPDTGTVQEFVETLTGLEGNFDLVSGDYILDARSLMGIFTFDLTKPVKLVVQLDTPANLAAVQKYVAPGATTC